MLYRMACVCMYFHGHGSHQSISDPWEASNNLIAGIDMTHVPQGGLFQKNVWRWNIEFLDDLGVSKK